jgi:spore germination protein KC
VEIDQLALVMGMGVDTAESDEGYNITVQLARAQMLSNNAGSGSSTGEPYINLEQESKTVYSAMQKLSFQSSRRMYTQLCGILILGEDVARADVTPILEYFLRSTEGHMTMPMMVARGNARDVLNEVTYLEPVPAQHIKRLSDNQDQTSEVATSTVFNFLCDLLDETTDATVPIVEMFQDTQGNSKARLAGTAIFKGHAWVGEFDYDQAQGMLLIKDRMQQSRVTVASLGGILDLQMTESHTRLIPHYENGAFWMEVQVFQKCLLANSSSSQHIDEVSEEREIVVMAQEAELLKMRSALATAQALGTDVFGFGASVRRAFPKEFRAIADNWPETFSAMPVTLNVKLSITGTGAALQPIEVNKEVPSR